MKNGSQPLTTETTVMPKSPRHSLRILSVVLSATALCGCTIAPPQPWERGNLARPEMTMGGDPLDQRFVQHIYGSKENASGGYGVGGGGCGCN